MNFVKLIFPFLIIYLLVLLQVSFFVHFNFWGWVPNFVIILVIFLNFFAKEENFFSSVFFQSLMAGFLLDIFSNRFFGFYTIILGMISLFIINLNRYFVFPWKEKRVSKVV